MVVLCLLNYDFRISKIPPKNINLTGTRFNDTMFG